MKSSDSFPRFPVGADWKARENLRLGQVGREAFWYGPQFGADGPFALCVRLISQPGHLDAAIRPAHSCAYHPLCSFDVEDDPSILESLLPLVSRSLGMMRGLNLFI